MQDFFKCGYQNEKEKSNKNITLLQLLTKSSFKIFKNPAEKPVSTPNIQLLTTITTKLVTASIHNKQSYLLDFFIS